MQLQASSSHPIRLVASDVDGTLLDSTHRIAPRTLQAIKAMRDKGVLFVPATGKSRSGVRNALGELGRELTDPAGGLSVGGVYLQVRVRKWGERSCVFIYMYVVTWVIYYTSFNLCIFKKTRHTQGLIVYKGEEVVFERTLEVCVSCVCVWYMCVYMIGRGYSCM